MPEERVVAFESIGESRAGAVLDGSIPPPPLEDGEAEDDESDASADDSKDEGGDGEPQS